MLDKERYIHKNMGTTDERFEIKERHRTMKKKKTKKKKSNNNNKAENKKKKKNHTKTN